MIKVAITGNIACGKSQAENILISLGFKVADTDKINHKLLQNTDIINELIKVFGSEIIDGQNVILRQKLGEIVFYSKDKRQKLENILHPKILEEVNNFFKINKDEEIVFVSVPLLFEVKWQNNFDKIIFISADENIRLKRLMTRNNFSEEYARQRINSQDKEKEKIQNSDFVIYNNSDLTDLKQNILKIINKINLLKSEQ